VTPKTVIESVREFIESELREPQAVILTMGGYHSLRDETDKLLAIESRNLKIFPPEILCIEGRMLDLYIKLNRDDKVNEETFIRIL